MVSGCATERDGGAGQLFFLTMRTCGDDGCGRRRDANPNLEAASKTRDFASAWAHGRRDKKFGDRTCAIGRTTHFRTFRATAHEKRRTREQKCLVGGAFRVGLRGRMMRRKEGAARVSQFFAFFGDTKRARAAVADEGGSRRRHGAEV